MDKILIVDDDLELLETIQQMLSSSGYNVSTCNNAADARDLIDNNQYSIIISDVEMPRHDGLWLARKINMAENSLILFTAFATVDRAVEALRLGIKDFIQKPFRKNELIESIEQHKRFIYSDEIIIKDPSTVKILSDVNKVGSSKAPILLTGDTGVGKDVFANLIHNQSNRAGEFVPVNCGSIPDGMLESILFGYEKGSFTGAYKKHSGKFIQSDGGTLFLDEIGEMDLNLQSKLLRVLETQSVDTIGSSKETPIDLNIISATNRDLTEMISDGSFREDLYYRINVIEINIPNLSDRKGDLLGLINLFLGRFNNDLDKKLTITQEALDKMTGYDWPGNIREMKNIIHRCCILCDKVIGHEDIPIFSEKINTHPIEEKTLIQKALDNNLGNRKDTAEDLGLSVRTLQYRIKKYNLKNK